jgi:hypothetical protein
LINDIVVFPLVVVGRSSRIEIFDQLIQLIVGIIVIDYDYQRVRCRPAAGHGVENAMPYEVAT